VHYSDQWVPGSEVIKSTKPHPVDTSAPVASHSQSTKTASTSSTAGQQNAAMQAVQQDKAKARDQQCKDAKEAYDKAIQARRIFKTKPGQKDTDGSDQREYLSDEEADAYRVKARQAVQDYCGTKSAE
jgi:hypothetical protein